MSVMFGSSALHCRLNFLLTSIMIVGCDPNDVTQPELSSVFVVIHGDYGSEVDLNANDQTCILPINTQATFRILAKDNQTQPGDLVVQVVDSNNNVPLATQKPTFRNGLWQIDITATLGSTVRVRVEDESGNAYLSRHRLILPQRCEAVVSTWELQVFDSDQSILESWVSTWSKNGDWVTTDPKSPSSSFGGTYECQADGMRILYRFGPTDSDPNTVEFAESSQYYIDDTLVSLKPWQRVGSGNSLADNWQRQLQISKNLGQGLELAKTLDESLLFSTGPVTDPDDPKLSWEGTWTEASEISEYDGKVVANKWTEERSGYFRVVTDNNYLGTFGSFLHRRVTKVDGNPVPAGEASFDLFYIRLDQLLIAPMFRR